MRKTALIIKPLSINDNCPIKKQAYFKEIEKQLPNSIKLPKGRLIINYDIYLSQQNADLGNCEKLTTDAICKAWNIQDSNFYEIHLHRFDCKKGQEKIIFNIEKPRGVTMKELFKKSEWLIIFILGTAFGVYIESIQEVVRSLSIG